MADISPASTTVIYGQVTPDEPPCSLDTNTSTFWEDYAVINRYESDKHVYMAGITSPNPFLGSSVAFYQLSTPTLLWMADWTAAQWLVSPAIPSTLTDDPNWVLMDITNVEAAMLDIAADGESQLYRLSATYVYGHRNPNPSLWPNLNYPKPPWLKDVYDRSIPIATLTGNIITGKGGQIGGKQGAGQFVG